MGYHGSSFKATVDFLLVDYCNYYQKTHVGGVLGLGVNSTNPLQILNSLKTSGIISQKVVGIFLNSVGNNLEFGSPRSNMILGGYDLSYSISPSSLFYIRLDTIYPGWITSVSGLYSASVGISYKNIAYFDMTVYSLQVDSGTYNQILTLLPSYSCISGYYRKIFMYYCLFKERYPDLPSLYITLGGINVTLADEAIWVYDGTQDIYNSSTYHTFYLTISESYQDYWVIGNSVLRYFYMIYDMENMRIGFAPAIKTESGSVLLFLSVLILAFT